MNRTVDTTVHLLADGSVNPTVDGALYTAVNTAVYWNAYWAVIAALHGDPYHPTLADFLVATGEEAA